MLCEFFVLEKCRGLPVHTAHCVTVPVLPLLAPRSQRLVPGLREACS